MKRRDARALDHKTLEEIRIRAVERVQAGESPEVVIGTLGYSRSCIYTWLALYRAGGWGALRARALTGRPMKIGPAQMGWLYSRIGNGFGSGDKRSLLPFASSPGGKDTEGRREWTSRSSD